MTLKTRVVGFLQYAQGDDVQTYLQRWLAQSMRLSDGLFDPVSGHNHNGSGTNGPVVAGGGGITMIWRGNWSAVTAYSKNDGVAYQGSSYIALNNVTSSTPPPSDPTNWGVLAQAGAPGSTGPQGPTGATGPQGPTGATGPQGPTGATGSQGPQGNTGAQGLPGTPGSVWWTGSGAPASGTGVVGDFYLNSANGDYYQKTGASTWTLQGNIRGPQGATGAQGPTGNTGPQGPAGQGVPTGGTANQVLSKINATDYNTQWTTPGAATWG